MKILIVEDDRNSLKLMAHFLNRFGTCDTASDGQEAVAAVMEAYRTEEPYDLVVLDVMMPNLDGIQALKSIRDYEKRLNLSGECGVKAVMISALSGDTVRAEAYQHGCIMYMRKPVDFHQLERVIREELFVK